MIDYLSSKGEHVFDIIMFLWFCWAVFAVLFLAYFLIHKLLERTTMTDRSKRITSVALIAVYVLGACFTHSWVYARYGCADKTLVKSTNNCLVDVQRDAIRNAIVWPLYWTSELSYQIIKATTDTVR